MIIKAITLAIFQIGKEIFQLLTLMFRLCWISGTAAYLLFMLPVAVVNGRFLSISESDNKSAIAIQYETYFFWIVIVFLALYLTLGFMKKVREHYCDLIEEK